MTGFKLSCVAISLGFAASAMAQQPPPGAATTPPPSWKQGITAEYEKSTLHPFAPHLTGRPASELPVSKLRVPDGFKIEV